MIRVLRPDHILIKDEDKNIVLKNINFEKVTYNIKPIHAFLLALYDGKREETEIKEITKVVLNKEDFKINNFMKSFFKKYKRFLLPIEKAEKIFVKPWVSYEPKEFLVKENREFHDEERLPAPLHLALYLTNNCIRRCRYCYAKAKFGKSIEQNSMTTEEMKNIIKEAFMLGVEGILLTGGEPLLRLDIYELINYATSLNIKVSLLTKARLKIDKLKLSDPNLVNLGLSIDSHIPEIANYLVGTNNFYEDMSSNISGLKAIKFPYVVGMVVTKKNKESIKESIKYFIDNGANFIDINHYMCTNPLEVDDSLFISDDEKKEIELELNEFVENNGLKDRVGDLSNKKEFKNVCSLECSTGRSRLTVRFDGTYIFCEKLANSDDINLGNIHSKSMLELWNSKELNDYIMPKREVYKSTLCYECDDFEHCKGKTSCIYDSKNQHGIYFRPAREVEDVCIKR